MRYPAGYPGVLGISAVGESGTLASFSTLDPTSTCRLRAPTSCPRRSGGGWGYDSGSSMATAHVSGVAALITGRAGRIGPATMADRLMGTATDAGPPGRDDAYGAGRLNPVDALFAQL